MMFPAVETMADADPQGRAGGLKPDGTAKAAAAGQWNRPLVFKPSKTNWTASAASNTPKMRLMT